MLSFGEWGRQVRQRMNEPHEVLCRSFPMIGLLVAATLGFGLLAIFAVLVVFGHTDSFGNRWYLAAFAAASVAGRLVSARRAGAEQEPSQGR